MFAFHVMTVVCAVVSFYSVAVYVVFHGMEIHFFYFCPEAVPVSHGLGLENRVRFRKAVVFALLVNQGFVEFQCVGYT